MGARLLYRDATGRDAAIDVPPDGVFLGRGADCAVRTDDAMVSRKNCKIAYTGGRWTVEDLGSSNGTFVNEVRIQKQILAHADVVRCGTLQVRFVETADAYPAQPQAQAQPQQQQRPRTMSIPAAGNSPSGPNVQVDPSLGGLQPMAAGLGMGGLNPQALMQAKDSELAQLAQERDTLAARVRETIQERDEARNLKEAQDGELQRLRGENVGYRDRLAQIQRDKSLLDDEIHALTKAGNELRQELEQLKAEYLGTKQRNEEVSDELQARERQLERAHEDVQRAKKATDEARNALAEVQKTKDEGWRELNTRVTEIDELRKVIAEQERILEERRMGLTTLEEAMQQARAEREKLMRSEAGLKNERDELRDKVMRQQHQVEALEEEQRRLARRLADQGAASGGGSASSNDDFLRQSNELRDLKVELRKAEAERTRFNERVETLERERANVAAELAKTDVERAAAVQAKGTIDAARTRLEERLAKAESARVKGEEDLAATQKARDEALTNADRARVDAERERKRAGDLELELKHTREAAAGASAALTKQAAEPQLVEDTTEFAVPETARVHQLELEVERLERALKEAHGNGVATASTAAAGGSAAAGASTNADIKRKAEEAYHGINDALSELRTNILLAKDLIAEHGKAVADQEAMHTLEDAINVSVDRTEDAKGLLRGLREVVES